MRCPGWPERQIKTSNFTPRRKFVNNDEVTTMVVIWVAKFFPPMNGDLGSHRRGKEAVNEERCRPLSESKLNTLRRSLHLHDADRQGLKIHLERSRHQLPSNEYVRIQYPIQTGPNLGTICNAVRIKSPPLCWRIGVTANVRQESGSVRPRGVSLLAGTLPRRAALRSACGPTPYPI